MGINVLLVDDHLIYREGVRMLLKDDAEIEVAGETSNGREAIEQARALRPDVILMDIQLPDISGIEATRQIVQDNSDQKIIAITMHTDPDYIEAMFKAGAKGYVSKYSSIKEIRDAIIAVAGNEAYISPRVARVILNDFELHACRTKTAADQVLTEREVEVLKYLASEKNTKEIASLLKVSTKTIDAHRNAIMKKLNLHSTAGLTKYAIRSGLTDL